MKGEFGTMDEAEKSYPIADVDVPKVVKVCVLVHVRVHTFMCCVRALAQKPSVRPTKASAAMAARAAEAATATVEKPWKMKKFAHVSPKITVRSR